MGDLRALAAALRAVEEPHLTEYDDLARRAVTGTERRLVDQMIRAQRFQLAALALAAEGMVPERFHCFAQITHNDVKVRQGPGPRQEVLRHVDQGEAVVVEEFEGNWAHIQLGDGERGWVFKDYVRCELTG